jgi:hypothetical protein
MVRTITSKSFAAGAAPAQGAVRTKDAGKRGRRSDSFVGTKKQRTSRKPQQWTRVLADNDENGDDEDDDDERGGDDNERSDTTESAIPDNDNEEDETSDEDEEDGAFEEQVRARNPPRQRNSGSATTRTSASNSTNCQAGAGNRSNRNSSAMIGTVQQRATGPHSARSTSIGVASVSFGTNSVSSATSAVTPATVHDSSGSGSTGVLGISYSGTVANTSTTASEGQGCLGDDTYRTAGAISYHGNHDVLQDQTFIRLPREVAETNRTANFLKERIQKFCKKELFKKVKFVASDSGLQHVMGRMAGIFQIPMAKKQAFKSQFKKTVMDSLNAKRAFCEQQAGKVVLSELRSTSAWDSLILTGRFQLTLFLVLSQGYLKQNCGDSDSLGDTDLEPESLLCTGRVTRLRRAGTQEEIDSANWFFAEYLECVAGKKGWGKEKYFQTVSKAVDRETNDILVTVSDEAFALLMLENYREKWILRYEEACSGRRNTDKRIDGKYTSSVKGHTEFGGWSRKGIKRFNALCDLVEADRSSEMAAAAEAGFMNYMRNTDRGAALIAKRTTGGADNTNEDDDDC